MTNIIKHIVGKSVKPIIEVTSDGSHTLFVPELEEHYHSVNGAVQESRHVFIDAGLHFHDKEKINVLEIGFGTGLNAFLTLMDIQTSGKEVIYTSLEAFPLGMDTITALNYPSAYSPQDQSLYYAMHEAEWGKEISITPNFTLTKLEVDFTCFDFSKLNCTIDLIYFDAFAPDKQPEMWTQTLFDSLYKVASAGAVLVTYCAKGSVRRMMQEAGFKVERIPGPPGKREMLRAVKPL